LIHFVYCPPWQNELAILKTAMRILHVIRDLSTATGGPVTAVQGLASAEAAAGHKVALLATDYGLPDELFIEGVELKIFPCTLAGWRYSRELAEALPEVVRTSDIVHIHTIWEHPAWVAARVCRKLGKPYILRPCGMLDSWSLSQSAWRKWLYLRLLAGSVIRNAAALHFTSEEELKNSLKPGGGVREFVVPNGLPPTAFEGLPGSEAFWFRYPELDGKRLLLFLGRLHYKKQPDVAIRAFRKVCDRDARLALVLAGPAEPEYLTRLRALVAELKLTERVFFTGLLQGAAVREAYCAAELFVLPSLQENFGIAVAEAMAAGCPVVVSEQVNLATTIRETGAGLVCKSDVDSLAAAMEKLLADDSLRKQMGSHGRATAKRDFSWSNVAERLLKEYDGLR